MRYGSRRARGRPGRYKLLNAELLAQVSSGNYGDAESCIGWDALTPDEAEKRESLRQANEAKEAARGRQKVLREAVVGGERRRTAELLRAHPEDVEAPDEHGRTLFWLAAAAGETEVLQELADNGARVDAAAEDGATALYAACHRGARDTVRNRMQTRLQTCLQTERLDL